jgi:hypothetical protein
MKTYMYTSAHVSELVSVGGGEGSSALKLLIFNVPSLIVCPTLSERFLTIETLNCVNDLSVSSMVYSMMCWNSGANVTVI